MYTVRIPTSVSQSISLNHPALTRAVRVSLALIIRVLHSYIYPHRRTPTTSKPIAIKIIFVRTIYKIYVLYKPYAPFVHMPYSHPTVADKGEIWQARVIGVKTTFAVKHSRTAWTGATTSRRRKRRSGIFLKD